MRGIVLDTCTERGVVAIVEGTNIIFQAQLPFGLQNAQFLLPTLQAGLKDASIELNTLAYIATGVGPGSYTGIRVGVTVAKTLAFACRMPIVGICTLDVFVPDNEGSFAVVIDAKIGGIYMQTGIKHGGGRFEVTSDPMVCTLDEGAKRLEHIPTIVTPNAEKIRLKFAQLTGCAWMESAPSCERLAELAQIKLRAGNHERFELLYMRKTQAELEKKMERA